MAVLPALLPPRTLTYLDRCDRCSAPARHRAVLPVGELLFCAHHARQHRAGLLDVGARLDPDP